MTVSSCAIPASSKSERRVFSFCVLRPATQKLSLKWLMAFSTFTRILYVESILPYHEHIRGKHEDFFQGRCKFILPQEEVVHGLSQWHTRLDFLVVLFHSHFIFGQTNFIVGSPQRRWDLLIPPNFPPQPLD